MTSAIVTENSELAVRVRQLESTNQHQQSHIQHLEARNHELEAQNQWLKEQFKLARHREFGSSSEKIALQSELLFNEAEATVDSTPAVVESETVTYVRKRKSAGHREEILANLPIEVIEHRLGEDEQVCSQCGGPMHEMSTQTRDELVIIPAQVKVNRHVRYVYGCRHCDKHEINVPIVTAPSPAPLIPKSLASASAVAYIMSQKYVEAMPLYRLEKHFDRMGIELPRQVISNWVIKGGEMLEPIYDRMHELLLTLDILHADETKLQVLKEPGRSAQTDSYMWLYRSGRYGPPIICYDYEEGRSGKYPRAFLRDFAGSLQVDAWRAYQDVKTATLVGCWSHARRKFCDALVIMPKESRKDPTLLANIAIKKIKDLYDIEREYRDVTPHERLIVRETLSKPIVDGFKDWMEKESPLVLSQSVLGQAFTYCRNQWPKLIRFLSDGRLEIDNNRAERSIKPFVIGRKNWLFANTPKGAKTSAIIYSIVETAKENGVNPFDYLQYIFERLPKLHVADKPAIDSLLPWSETVQATLRVRRDTTPS